MPESKPDPIDVERVLEARGRIRALGGDPTLEVGQLNQVDWLRRARRGP